MEKREFVLIILGIAIILFSVAFLMNKAVTSGKVIYEATNLISNPNFEQDLASWYISASPTNESASTTIVTDGCISGKCLKMIKGSSTWQGAAQKIGPMVPGQAYLLKVGFNSSSLHNAFIGLYDNDWKNSTGSKNNSQKKIFTSVKRGTGVWDSISIDTTIPTIDDFRESTANHNWYLYLYGYSTGSATDPIYYDNVSLREDSQICTDNDDGINLNTQGTTFGRYLTTTPGYENPIQRIDYCWTTSTSGNTNIITTCNDINCHITEYYCNSSGYLNFNYSLCPEGCNNGACTTASNRNDSNNDSDNGNGIIGNFNSFYQENINLGVYLNSELGNISKKYNGTKLIEFRENGISKINYSYDFDNTLNMSNVRIIKEPVNSSFGYLVIDGLIGNKSILVDKINGSNSICIKDAQNIGISDFSSTCSYYDEYLLGCPGNTSGFICTINGNYYSISGLTNSAVREMPFDNSSSYFGISNCTANWSCGEWSGCFAGSESRVCSDFNNCGNYSGEPEQTRSCGGDIADSCIPDWNCGTWTPAVCPKSQSQTRSCSDLNQCELNQLTKNETQQCTHRSNFIWTVLLIIGIGGIVVLVIILFLLRNKQKGNNASGGYDANVSQSFFPPNNKPDYQPAKVKEDFGNMKRGN